MLKFTKTLKGNKKGFSLFELLVIIFIISLLSSAATYFLGGAKEKSRDFQRISDVKTIQNALGLYFVDHGYYPEAITEGMSIVSADGNTTYLDKVPTAPPVPDPANDTEGYNYTRDASKTSYTISYYLAKEVGGSGSGGLSGNCVADPNSECGCVASCADKECGDDGCGGNCGTCASGYTCSNNSCSVFAGGDGSSGSPYQIVSCEGLQAISNSLNSYYVLNNDIDCSGTTSWNSGTGFMPISYFAGNLDGANHTISNLYINRLTTSNQAIFGYTTSNCTITNLTLSNFNIKGFDFVAALFSRSSSTVTITNVHVVGGTITANRSYAGGIGGSVSGNISKSSSSASIACSSECGGFIGEGGNITNSYATGDVSVVSGKGGGFIGTINRSMSISNSYATGNVTSSNNATKLGGFAGDSDYAGGIFTDCFSTGSVSSGGSTLGGFLGYNSPATLTRVYWDEIRSGQTDCYSGGNTGCTAVNTASNPDTNYWYNNSTNAPMSNWDFTTVWQTTSTYPTLR